jgi:hypothetical protein
MPEPDEYVTEESIEHELEDLIREATQRPITDDEAHFIAFQCGVRYARNFQHAR